MSPETAHRVTVTVLAGLLGAGVGWAAQALTLSGRVQAVEAGQARIEAMLTRLIEAKATAHDATPGAR